MSPRGECAAEAVLGIFAGTWFAAFILDISGLTGKNTLGAGVLAIVSCAAAVLAVHCLLEWKFQSGVRRIFRENFSCLQRHLRECVSAELF